MNFPFFLCFGLGLVINRLAQKVEDTSKRLLTDGNLYRRSRVDRLHTAHKSVRAAHCDAADKIVADMLRYLDDQLLAAIVYLDSVKQIGQIFGRETDIQNRADNLDYRAYVLICHFITFPFFRNC